MPTTIKSLALLSTMLTAAFASAPSFSASASATDKPTLRICTGPEGGNYQRAARIVGQLLRGSMTVEYIDPTPGSIGNLDKLVAGDCDVAPVQKDAILVYSNKHPNQATKFEQAGTLYDELVHLMCNKGAKVGRVTDLRSGNHKLAIGSLESGSAVTRDSFVAADKGYEKAPISTAGGIRAIEQAKIGTDVKCVLFTSALNSKTIREADQFSEGKLELIRVNDGDFDTAKDPASKKPIYSYVKIPSGTYPNLQSGSVSTVAVEAIWAIRTDFADSKPKQYEAFIRGKNMAAPEILKLVGQQK